MASLVIGQTRRTLLVGLLGSCENHEKDILITGKTRADLAVDHKVQGWRKPGFISSGATAWFSFPFKVSLWEVSVTDRCRELDS